MKYNLAKIKASVTKGKKGGFTLIELVAVMCIIGILAAVLIPKVGGYITEAKKVKVIDQSRKVVMAVESYDLKHTEQINKSSTVSAIRDTDGIKGYLDDADLSNIDSATVQNCYDIVDGAEFNLIKDSEKLDTGHIVPKANNTPQNGSGSAGSTGQ